MEQLPTWVSSGLKWLAQGWSKGCCVDFGFCLISVLIIACSGWVLFSILAWLFSKARTRIAYKLSPLMLGICAALASLGSVGFALWLIGGPPDLSWKIFPWVGALLTGPVTALIVRSGLLAERTRMVLILDQHHPIP